MSDEETEQPEESEGSEGSEESGGGKRPDQEEPDEAEREQIEQEREERLAPENRPNNAEVDNTQRDFDEETGEFQDDSDESDLTDEERAVTEQD